MKKGAILLLVSALLLIQTSNGLTIDVSGNCVGEKLKITVDKPSFIVIRINNGTPIYANGTTAYFTPQLTGKLYIEAISGSEKASKLVDVVSCQTKGGSEPMGDYTLPSGTTTISADGESVSIKYRTALGALIRAAEVKGFSVKVKKWSYGLFVDCIKGVCTGDLGATSGWMYAVDGVIPSVSSEQYELNAGDKVVWYFSRSMSETPESSPYRIEIITFPDWTFSVNVYWKTPSYEEAEAPASTPSPTPTPAPEKKERVIELNLTKRAEVVKPNETLAIDLKIPMRLKIEGEKPVLIELAQRKVGGVEFRNVHGDVLEAFELKVNESAKILLNFSVKKELLENKSPENLCLAKYVEYEWKCLKTNLIDENETHYFFSSKITNFSLFAIIVKWDNFPLKPEDERIVKALNWLKSVQNDDGGFSNPGEESSVAKTSWAIMALVAAGEDPEKWKKNGKSPIDYLRENLEDELPKMGTADYARTILALVAAGEDPRSFAGVNLVEKLKERVKENGQIGDYIYTTIWGILALVSVGEDVNKSVDWLKEQQNGDGGFAWAVGEKSDFDDTAAAIQALIAAGESKDSEVIKKALSYLKQGQNEDGGMRYFGNSASNAASDSWTIQALVAAGINPVEWKKNNISVVDHLLSLQTEESYFKYTSHQTSNPGYMTVSAIMALLGKPHPIKVMEKEEVSAPTPTPAKVLETPKPEKTSEKIVEETPTQTPAPEIKETPIPKPTEEKKGIPGFEAVIALLVLAARAVRK
ncbi:Prenyltransferase/squalene oxidase [Ferroglobus placidus DSM 10642]|uniref:Prenyltransferase/squalene oxidase n=1 Tax=Ferroglobus placidus (strain DSM 10642 / AEDII12DO) TaxID=589924 RepID=D3S0E7_FERPA|nr:DUF4430 domain-containing protein [Ferroglobus placidus]ADC66210.1 Prenyltransferase/squalene oxidase [Ferroglobus placidus DSM 10642]